MKLFRVCLFSFCLVYVFRGDAFSLDREAFSVTNYDLNVRIEPEQQRLAVRGKISLRNDSQIPQKIAVLQISSSLDWRSIRAGDKAVEFVSQPYASDIDHTGALSEVVASLPQAVLPQAAIDLEIAYDGVIPLDAERLIRLDTPERTAKSTDWDQIGTNFTALRGAGYVAWYPMATGGASLADGDSLFEALDSWKHREAGSKMRLQVAVVDERDRSLAIIFNGVRCDTREATGAQARAEYDCASQGLGLNSPTLVLADYLTLERPDIEVLYLRGHDAAATEFGDVAEKVAPFISEWFGIRREKVKTADLPFPDAAPFESGSLLLTPLANVDSYVAGLAAVHQLTHGAFSAPRPWIEEGLAHFAQALYLEQQKGRQSAIDYMGVHRLAFSESGTSTTLPRSDDEARRSLINTLNEEIYRSKAMCVWWMLRDMIGDSALKKALAAYKPEQDKEPSYMPKVIQAQTQRDLEWFFDDWVYRDRGLPDFRVESAFSRKTMNDLYILTITIENLGAAGAEVPVTVTYSGGTFTKRLEVRGKSKAITRVEVTGAPQEVVVNDGSVPESDTTNNAYKIESSKIDTGPPAQRP
jgi:hypothetical protein